MNNSAEIKLGTQATLSVSNKYFLAFLTLFILPISGLGIDIYVPSLPAVSQYFAVDKSLAQLTITSYMVGLGIMQLFAGPISDSFGRRNPFLIAMFFYITATLFIPMAATIQQLLLLRLIQGMMVAVIIVPLRSIVSDLFSGHEYFKMVNYMTMAWSIGPIVAPAIGGYLQHYFGWQANFYFLGVYSLISFILNAYFLPETSRYRHKFRFLEILSRYKEIIFHRVFLSGLMINASLYSIIMFFAVVAPFLVQNVMGYTPVEFGQFALLTGLAWFLGSMINRFFIHVPLPTKTRFCLWSMLVIAIATLVFDLLLPMNIYLIIVPVFLLETLGGTVFPNNFAHAIALFPKTTGSANALFGGFLFLLTGVSSGIATLLKSTTAIPLSIAYVILIGLCLIIHYGISRK